MKYGELVCWFKKAVKLLLLRHTNKMCGQNWRKPVYGAPPPSGPQNMNDEYFFSRPAVTDDIEFWHWFKIGGFITDTGLSFNMSRVAHYSVWLRAGRPGDRGSIPGRGKRYFLSPLCSDRLWGPPSLLYNGYRGSFPRG
jgi:hypothetical protein